MDIDAIDREGFIQLDSPTFENFDNDPSDPDDGELDELGLNLGDELEKDASDNSITPKEGMLFSTQDEAFKFYNRYALKMGFGIRWSSTSTSRSDKTKIIGRKFICNKEGKKKNSTELENHRREVRVGCNALMSIRLTESESWKVSNFVSQHNNHEMSTPSKAPKHRSHKKCHRKPVVRELITQLHSEGISNASIARVVNTFEPGSDHMITSQQVHDHLRIERKSNLGKNCGIIVNHFMNKKANDAYFF